MGWVGGLGYKAEKDTGFCFSRGKVWQMVPVQGIRRLVFWDYNNLTPRSIHPEICDVQQNYTESSFETTLPLLQPITLVAGLRPGRTYIVWEDANGVKNREFTLEVSVKKLKIVRTTFFYYDDGGRQVTKRELVNLPKLIRTANKILLPQANVQITDTGHSRLLFKPDRKLGPVVGWRRKNGVWNKSLEWNIVARHRDKARGTNLTVFFVDSFEDDRTNNIDHSDGAQLRNVVLIEDGTYGFSTDVGIGDDDPITLAHEVTHFLGIRKHHKNRNNLMFNGKRRGRLQYIGPTVYSSGITITKFQANRINRSGRR